MKRRFHALAACALLLVATSSFAQTIDAAQATALFQEGRQALAAGDYTRACDAFTESLRLDVKVGTLLNLADCEEHRRELAQAYAHWQQAIDRATAGHDERLAYLETRLASLDARVPKLTITRAPQQNDTAITRDGIALGEASIGRALPVDPGKHTIVASAPGRVAKTYVVDLREGARIGVEVAPERASADVAPPPPAPVKTNPSKGGGSTQRTLALVAAGVGLVGTAVGIAYAATAFTKKGRLADDTRCSSAGACDSAESAAAWNATRDDAQNAARVSTVAFVVGAGALAAGAILWLTAPTPARDTSARLRLGPRGVELFGWW